MAEDANIHRGKKLKLTPESVALARAGAAPTFGPEPTAALREHDLGGAPLDWMNMPPLTGEGLLTWEHLANTFMDEPTRFREADRPAVTSFCEVAEMRALAAEALREEGVMVDGRGDHDRGRVVRNPAWGMWRDADTSFRAWSNVLGLNPTSRKRAGGPKAATTTTPADNPFTRSAQQAMNKRTGA
nr:phage terminase small subunit P27 family [Propionibacterium sp.]